MDQVKQYECMALIRSYAARIAAENPDDTRPSTAADSYAKRVYRMANLIKDLKTCS